jgi:hypothetical protein
MNQKDFVQLAETYFSGKSYPSQKKTKIVFNSPIFNGICNIANNRSPETVVKKNNLAEIGHALQLAYVLGITVLGLRQIESEIKNANPHFTGWNLIPFDEYCWNLRFLDEMELEPLKKFEQSFLAQIETAKKYLSQINSNA